MDLEKNTIHPEFWTAHSTFSEQAIALTFVGTSDPSIPLVETFDFMTAGEMMTFSFEIVFQSSGLAVSEISFPFPGSGDGSLIPDLFLGNGQAAVCAYGRAAALEAVDGEPFVWTCWLEKSASEEYTVRLKGSSSNVKMVIGSISYHKEQS